MTEPNPQNQKQSNIGTVFIALILFGLSIAIAFYVQHQQYGVLQQILKGQAERTEKRLIQSTFDLMADLKAMSKRWVKDNNTPEANWRSDANDFIERIEGVDSIWWVDADFNSQWSEGYLQNHSSRSTEVLQDEDVVLKLIRSKENFQPEITHTFFYDDGHVVYIFQPIGQGQNFAGFLGIEVHVKEFIDHLLGDPANSGHYTKAYSSQDVVFQNGPTLTDDSYLEFFELNLDSDSNGWVFKVYPTESSLALIISPMPYFIAGAGSLISLLFMLTLMSRQKAQNKSAQLANEISEKEKVQFELEYLANHDTLTHLPNRHYITNFIEKRVKFSQTSQQKFTILFIDLDHFKDINDTLGHAVGDEMLKKLPVLFNRVFRHDDVIARMGGDEFVVYLPGEMSTEHVTKLVKRFLQSLEYPIQIDEHLIRLTGSVGVAFYPQHGSTVTELLSHADAALYRAKDEGRNTFAIYDSEIEQKAKDRIQLIARLHLAKDNEEFEMHFQPRYNLKNNTVCGAEALLRWNRNGAVIEPVEFINLLEETSLIIPVSWRMLESSCKQFVKLLEANPELIMSFNVSAKQLEHPDFLHRLKTTLSETQFPPSNLELELTEQTLIQNVENSQYILSEVTQLGIAIAIDDFGTGYSSLSYLKNFPVDVLKIDQSFIRDIDSDKDDLELVRTMITMGKNLNITTVAEGVENEAQLQLLRTEDCDQVQGHYFKTAMKFYDYYQLVNS
ncbi:putative bifunctional diguanylate cyclase/phosphodiesterase [Marinicella meishanensis]|uniref:putative bifunctional diguanylate cyclase/phosphodiesterase n=1 Tax=Marinicella meishanensis TaxID=2873263 RepID=UPI001CBCBD43|nr:EAL domain-containing protein [Marinicella sp. NBU2979]